MQKITLFVILLASLAYGCKKSTTTTVTPTVLYIPRNLDSLMPTLSTPLPGVPLTGVAGILTACKASGSLTDTGGITSVYNRSWQNAALADSVSSVRVNAVALPVHFYTAAWGDQKMYLNNYDDGTLWNEAATNNWTLNDISTPSFSTDLYGAMPVFTGALPASVSTTSNFEYTFDASNTSGADSAYVIIYTYGYFAQSPVVTAHGGVAKINASQFRFSASLAVAPGDLQIRIDGKIYNGVPMAIILYSHTFGYYGGKKYAFVKQRVVLHVVKLT